MSRTLPALRLCRCKVSDPGHALGLRSGDLLIGIGLSPAGADIQQLHAAFAPGDPVMLTFQRGDVTWPVLVSRADLGPWAQTEITDHYGMVHRPGMHNWAVVTNASGITDIISMGQPLLALVLPVLWLAQQRLWTLAGTVVAALAVALPAGPWLMMAIWIGAGLHLWRSGPGYLRADRKASGWHTRAVIAARSEADIMRLWVQLNPGAQFRFKSPPPQSEPITA